MLTHYIPDAQGKPAESCDAAFRRVYVRNLVAKSFTGIDEPEMADDIVLTEHCSKTPGHGGKHLLAFSSSFLEEYDGLPEGWETEPEIQEQVDAWVAVGKPRIGRA